MSGYNGSATITFMVERAKDSEGKYLPVKEGDDPERIEEFELEVTGRSYFTPGRLSGPPEDCYPDEGETEIELITLDGKPWDGELTEEESESVEAKIDEAVSSDDSDYPEPDDREYDESPYDGDYDMFDEPEDY